MALACALAASITGRPALASVTLDAGYGDHMVLQQSEPIVISGIASPNTRVEGDFDGEKASTISDVTGAFQLTFSQRSASDTPSEFSITDGKDTVVVTDILVGNVWLCSGQSNMELSVDRALDSYNQLQAADDTRLRLLMVPKDTATTPRHEFSRPAAWAAATADTVPPFSAACYYMGKQLRANDNVPVGLIHSNWGGSAARAWLSPQGAANLEGEESLALLKLYSTDRMAATRRFVPKWYDWWRAKDEDREPWTDPSMLDWKPVPKISFWNDWIGSGLDTDPVANVWFKREFELTAEQARAGGTLSVGALDDLDLTWVNGHPVGYTFGWGVERQYDMHAADLKPGKNAVLIAVSNFWGTGGFFTGADRLFFETANGTKIPLGDGWQYSIGRVDGAPPRAPWDANAGLGVMHNAMIAPLGDMRIKGVAWYQGESDVGQSNYDAKLRELFAGWRSQFGDQARMLVVQLADFGARSAKPVASGWAQLRDEQRIAVQADANATLITALDIGEPTDIHPANKNLLGKRLAMAARGVKMPEPVSARIDEGVIVLKFEGVEGPLQSYSGIYPLAFELCGDEEQSCRFALAQIDGSQIRLTTDGSPVTRVRYAWSDAPVVNLYDARDLPLPGFEIGVTK